MKWREPSRRLLTRDEARRIEWCLEDWHADRGRQVLCLPEVIAAPPVTSRGVQPRRQLLRDRIRVTTGLVLLALLVLLGRRP